jgi:DNA anti-recombination protein RmuC
LRSVDLDRHAKQSRLSFCGTPSEGGKVGFQNFEEVWAALGRLYSDIVKLQESQQVVTAQLNQLVESQAQLTESLRQLVASQSLLTESQNRMVSTVTTLAGNMTQLASIVDLHERRLDRLEGQ